MIRDISEYGQEKKLFYIYNYKHAFKQASKFQICPQFKENMSSCIDIDPQIHDAIIKLSIILF